MNTILEAKNTLTTGTWNVDATHSHVGFAVDYMGGTFRGTFSPFEATLTVAEDGTATLEGSAPVTGVHVQDENLAGHLQSPDFFDAELTPEITFRSSAIDRSGDDVTVNGDLTIRDNDAAGRPHRNGRRAGRGSVRRHALLAPPRGHDRPHRLRAQLEQPAPER